MLSRGLGAGDRSSAGSTHLGASGHGRHAHHSRPHRTSMSTAADGMPAAAGAGAGQRPGGRRRDSEGGGLTAQTSRHLGSPCPSSAGVAPVPLHAGRPPRKHWAGEGLWVPVLSQHIALSCVRSKLVSCFCVRELTTHAGVLPYHPSPPPFEP